MDAEIFFTILVALFVFTVLAVVAYAIYELTPFAQHAETFRDPETGRRRWQSPSVD